MDDFIEPCFPIVKQEFFSEDVMKSILIDSNFSKTDRQRLSLYNKNKTSAGKCSVIYKLTEGCETLKLGRLYPEKGLGIGSFSRIIRNPLCFERYWDLDLVNAHYQIALKYAKNNNLKHDLLLDYCNNREKWLSITSSDRMISKTEFLKILYGGDIKLYSENYELQEGDITKEGKTFLLNLSYEIQALMNSIWIVNPHLHNFKTKSKGSVSISNKHNPQASLMSLILQTEERKLLMKIDNYLKQKGRPFSVLIHDGGYIEKKEGESIEEINEFCKEITTYLVDFSVSVKPIIHDWEKSESSQSQYERYKIEFEKNHKIIGSNLLIHFEDTLKCDMIKLKHRDPRFHNLNWMEEVNEKQVKKFFYDEFLSDKTIIHYDRIDFIPDKEKVPKGVYNLFTGFKAEENLLDMNEETINELVAPIIEHFNYLTSENSYWILNWLANIIQDPIRRSEICPLIRDEGNLMINSGGTGKSSIMTWIIDNIIGSKYCYVVANNQEMYSDFNGVFEGKLLVIVEEANGDANFKNNDKLKAMTTREKQTINRKGIEAYEVRDYSRWMFFTNNHNPIAINSSSRRFAVFDTNPVKRGDELYFNFLFNHLKKPDVKNAFFLYLKNLNNVPNSPIAWFKTIPITKALREVMYMNSSSLLKWIIFNLKGKLIINGFVSELYQQFKSFVREKREGKEETMMTECSFGIALSVSPETGEFKIGDKHRTAEGQFFTWNIESIIYHLKLKRLLSDDFQYDNDYFEENVVLTETIKKWISSIELKNEYLSILHDEFMVECEEKISQTAFGLCINQYGSTTKKSDGVFFTWNVGGQAPLQPLHWKKSGL